MLRYVLNGDLYTRAWKFAATAHLGQTVPGSELPYIVHVGNVGLEVMTAIINSGDVEDPDLAVQCALLHDVIEDTAVSYEEVLDLFGPRVADGVAALTKNPDLADKSQMMEDSLMRICAQPAEVWMVKMADRITNLQPPPSHWSTEKILTYRQEAIRIHQALHIANAYLSTQLSQAIDAYGLQTLGARGVRDPHAISSLPTDFHLEYYWRAGTVPPPYHYEYRVRVDASGHGEVVFRPDYPSEQPPEWSESFSIPRRELLRLYRQMMERKVLGRQWELIPDMEAPIGGELESMEIVEEARRHEVPSTIVDESRVDAIYRIIRSFVPETTWQSLMERREAYIREQLGE